MMKLLVSKRSDLAGVRWVGEGISGATRVISNPLSLSSIALNSYSHPTCLLSAQESPQL